MPQNEKMSTWTRQRDNQISSRYALIPPSHTSNRHSRWIQQRQRTSTPVINVLIDLWLFFSIRSPPYNSIHASTTYYILFFVVVLVWLRCFLLLFLLRFVHFFHFVIFFFFLENKKFCARTLARDSRDNSGKDDCLWCRNKKWYNIDTPISWSYEFFIVFIVGRHIWVGSIDAVSRNIAKFIGCILIPMLHLFKFSGENFLISFKSDSDCGYFSFCRSSSHLTRPQPR